MSTYRVSTSTLLRCACYEFLLYTWFGCFASSISCRISPKRESPAGLISQSAFMFFRGPEKKGAAFKDCWPTRACWGNHAPAPARVLRERNCSLFILACSVRERSAVIARSFRRFADDLPQDPPTTGVCSTSLTGIMSFGMLAFMRSVNQSGCSSIQVL